VEDSGIGIKEEDKCKLFKVFGKLGGETCNSINPQGIGLGLSICNKILSQFKS
jgi:signal transduction histidine kinase